MLVGVVKKQHNGGARQTPNWFNVWLDNLFNCIFKWFAGTHNTHSYLPLHLHRHLHLHYVSTYGCSCSGGAARGRQRIFCFCFSFSALINHTMPKNETGYGLRVYSNVSWHTIYEYILCNSVSGRRLTPRGNELHLRIRRIRM